MPCTAQPGFLNITGGARNDFGKSLIRSSKNSFVIAGSSASFTPGNLDAILLSYNNNGGFIWGRTVGGNNDDALNKVVETADGGFIATGYSYSYGNGQECIVVKIDSTGALIWMNTYGGTGDDEGHSIFAMPDQGFLLCGATSSFGSGTQKDGFILRADINGNIIFSKLYGGTGEDYFKDIVLNGTNSIITAGTHQNTSNFDAWILQTDTNGNVLNSNTYGGNGNEEITAIDINQSGFFIGGKTTSYNNGLESGFIALANAGLGLTNTKVYGMASLNYYTSSVVKLYGNGFAFALNANNNVVNNNDGLIVKTDNNLNTQWFKLLGKTKNDAMYSVCNTLEGGVAAVGHTNSFTVGLLDMFFLKADSSGVFNRLNCGPQGNIFEQIVNFSNNAYAVTPRVWPINRSQPNNSTLIVNPITIDFCLPIDAGFIADTVICEGDCIDIVDTSFNATTRYWAIWPSLR